jgi:hypothetical protein
MRYLAWLGVGLLALGAAGYIYVVLSGAVIVHGATEGVADVVLAGGASERSLTRLPGGTFFGIPDQDADVQVRCRDGSMAHGGYATGGMRTWVKVVNSSPCRVIEEF